MITLIVPEYCQSCTDFEPQVTQRPEQVETGYGNLIFCGDTYVECEYRHRCKAIYEHLEKAVKRRKNNDSEVQDRNIKLANERLMNV